MQTVVVRIIFYRNKKITRLQILVVVPQVNILLRNIVF